MSAPTFPRIELNGRPAGPDDLRHLIQTNYGHFTSFRVENRGVRGLDLHLDRLQKATRELFGTALDRERIRTCLRSAVGDDDGELSVRINVFSRSLDREHLDRAVDADLLMIVSPARPREATPMRVKSFAYKRELAAIKHVGTFPLFHHRRLARQAGFDDAVFVDEDGRISEGSIWNIGFVDHDGAVVWPDGPQLDGIGMQLLKASLATEGLRSIVRTIRLYDLDGFRAAFFTNSNVPMRPIAAIDEHRFDVDADLQRKLTRCHDAQPLQRL